MWPIRFSSKTLLGKNWLRFPFLSKKRIDTRIRALSENPRPSGIKKLAGDENLYRLRVSDYRIIYQIQDKALLVLVIKISLHREVYRKR